MSIYSNNREREHGENHRSMKKKEHENHTNNWLHCICGKWRPENEGWCRSENDAIIMSMHGTFRRRKKTHIIYREITSANNQAEIEMKAI